MSQFTRFLIGGVLYFTTVTAMEPVLPLYIVALGGSPAMVGVIMAAGSILPLVLALWMGTLALRIGCRGTMVLGTALMTVAMAVFVGSDSLAGVVAAQILFGVGYGLRVFANQSWVAWTSTGTDLYRNFGYYAFAMSFGQLGGPVFGGWLLEAGAGWWPVEHGGYRVFFLVALGLNLLSGWIHYALEEVAPTKAAAPDHKGLTYVWGIASERRMRLDLATSFLLWLGIALKRSYFPLHLEQTGLSPTMIGVVLSTYGLFSMLVRPLVGTVVRLVGQTPLMVVIFCSFALVVGLVPFTAGFWLLAVLAAAWGTMHGLAVPLVMAMVPDIVEPAHRGVAVSLRIGINRFGEGFSPLIFGLMAGALGLVAPFLFASVVFVGGSALAIALGRALRGKQQTPVESRL